MKLERTIQIGSVHLVWSTYIRQRRCDTHFEDVFRDGAGDVRSLEYEAGASEEEGARVAGQGRGGAPGDFSPGERFASKATLHG